VEDNDRVSENLKIVADKSYNLKVDSYSYYHHCYCYFDKVGTNYVMSTEVEAAYMHFEMVEHGKQMNYPLTDFHRLIHFLLS
jgi:hypothetical protein